MVESPGNVTRILRAASEGDERAADELLPLIYDELRRLARHRLNAETPGQTLQPTALVHEAYLKLVGSDDAGWDSRGHFFAAAARAMRQILTDRARMKLTAKHGGGHRRIDFEQIDAVIEEPPPEEFLALSETLEQLERIDPRKARIVMLRYFTGLTIAETAEALQLSKTTVKDEWQFARAWLYQAMNPDGRSGD